MTADQLWYRVLQTLTEHIQLPAGFERAPMLAAAITLVIGLLLIARGARWARGATAAAFALGGGLTGAWLSPQIATPLWPTVGMIGVVGLVLGLAFFRFWQATLLAACCVVAGLSVYFAKSLTPAVDGWLNAGLDQQQWVTLPPPGAVVGEQAQAVMPKLASLWSHLSATVPSFQQNLWAIVISTALAGLVFGLLLPRASRALWAATLGTLFLGVGLAGLMRDYTPTALSWLTANTAAAWGLVGVIWLTAFVYNLRSTHRAGRKSTAAEPAPQPAS